MAKFLGQFSILLGQFLSVWASFREAAPSGRVEGIPGGMFLGQFLGQFSASFKVAKSRARDGFGQYGQLLRIGYSLF